MKNEQELKEIVKERYAKIAEQGKVENASSCCGATTPSNKVYNIMMDDYSETGGRKTMNSSSRTRSSVVRARSSNRSRSRLSGRSNATLYASFSRV